MDDHQKDFFEKQKEFFPKIKILDPREPPRDTCFLNPTKTESELLNQDDKIIKGYDFNDGVQPEELLKKYKNIGFQASNVSNAISIINRMLKWRLSDQPVTKYTYKEYENMDLRKRTPCHIYLSFTSNLMQSGLRETIRFLVEHKLVHTIATSGGAIEEDLMKSITDGNSSLILPKYDCKEDLKKLGIKKWGNMIQTKSARVKFRIWMLKILDKMLEEQKKDDVLWTASKMIRRFGKEINDEKSICYWAYKNKIPIFCPLFTDGLIGDCIYIHSYKNPGLVIDVCRDCPYDRTVAPYEYEVKRGIVVLGGGTSKHHILNANCMVQGCDYAVYINTAQPFDGSDSGGSCGEAITWGKILLDAKYVKVCSEATLAFPIIVSESFAKYHFERKEKGLGKEELNYV